MSASRAIIGTRCRYRTALDAWADAIGEVGGKAEDGVDEVH